MDNLAQKFVTFGITNIATLISYQIPRWISKHSTKHKETKLFFNDFFSTFEKQYEEHEKTFDPDCIRDFLDAYIAERHRVNAEKDTESSFYGKAGHWNFVNTIFDLFLAGLLLCYYICTLYIIKAMLLSDAPFFFSYFQALRQQAPQ